MLLLLAFAPGCGASDPVAEATALLETEDVEGALEVLREAVEESPGDPALNHLYGQALIANQQAGLASWPLRRATEDPEWAVKSGLLLTQSLLLTQNHHEAVRAADAVLADDPDNLAAVRLRADARLGAQMPDAAIEDLTRLIEAFPDELLHREKKLNVLLDQERFDEAEALLADLRRAVEVRDDLPDSAEGLLCSREAGLEVRRGNAEEARRRIERCLESYPEHRLVIRQAVEFFDQSGERERATEILRAGTRLLPGDVDLLDQLADRLVAAGAPEEASRELREAAERLDTPLAWMALRNHCVVHDDMDGALAATDRLLQSFAGRAPDDPQFRYDRIPEDRLFEAAVVVAMAGDFARAEKMGEHLREKSYARLLEARIHYERDELEAALDAWDDAFRLFPSNPGARHLAGLAALRTGDVDLALEHLRNALRTRSDESDVGMVLANVYLARGSPLSALDSLHYHLAQNPGDADGLLLQARIAAQLGRDDAARSALALLFDVDPGKAIATRARAIEAQRGSEAALRYLDEGVDLDLEDPAHVEALAAWVERMVALDRADEAVGRVARVSAVHPESADLHALHGAALGVSGGDDDARKALARALALDPDHHQALVARARLDVRAGDVDAAVAGFERAASLEDSDPTPIYEAVDALLAADRDDEAYERLEALLKRRPWEGRAAQILASAALASGDHGDRALALAERAAVFFADPGSAAFETLGRMRLARGEPDDAVVALRRAASLGAGGPSGLYRVGSALSEAGDVEGAIHALEAALKRDDFPEAEQARKALAELQATG